MNKILVPLEPKADLAHHAAQFAVSLARRTGGELIFLDFADGGHHPHGYRQPVPPPAPSLDPDLEALINQSRLEGIKVANHAAQGDFVRKVVEFARQLNISRVVVAMPQPQEPEFQRAAQQVAALRRNLSCPLVVVRPRQESPYVSPLAPAPPQPNREN